LNIRLLNPISTGSVEPLRVLHQRLEGLDQN
jgi:hypothetical protein